MSITTYAELIASIEALSVTGIVHVFQGPPAALNTADLPALWCQAPKGDEAALTFTASGGWPTLTVDVFVAIEPAAQSMQAHNFARQVAALDNLAAALRTVHVCKAPLSWSIRAAMISVAGADYWGVVATVTGRG